MNTITHNFNKKKKIKLIGLISIALICVLSLILFLNVLKNTEVIYANEDLNFYIKNDKYVVFSKEFAGIYEFLNQSRLLMLETPISGVAPENIKIDTKKNTISNKKYMPLSRVNFELSLDSLFKIDLLLLDTASLSNEIEVLKPYNNISWFSEMILGEPRKCARIVDGKEKSLFEIYFSKTNEVESIVIKNDPENINKIKKFFNIKKAKSLPYIETPHGNLVFFATNGTISAIKNKANGKIAKFEIRLYGSSGLLFVENFMTDLENNNK